MMQKSPLSLDPNNQAKEDAHNNKSIRKHAY